MILTACMICKEKKNSIIVPVMIITVDTKLPWSGIKIWKMFLSWSKKSQGICGDWSGKAGKDLKNQGIRELLATAVKENTYSVQGARMYFSREILQAHLPPH